MTVIKLDAIDSTNDYLKQLATFQDLKSFTVVATEMQTAGKGQMGAKWFSEAGKNLMVSILINENNLKSTELFLLNSAVALSIVNVLNANSIPKVSIKWPNDIMADSKKVAGILIENSLKSSGTFVSIIGIGLNVNQTNFENLPQASSLKKVTAKEFDRDLILEQILFVLKSYVKAIQNGNYFEIWNDYQNNLFKKGVPMVFEEIEGNKFMGIIKGVTNEGKLELQLENDSLKTYSIKEIRMFY